MPEPSLGEIINSADPERGTGIPATIYSNMPLVQELNQAAQYKSENDWRKYNTFLTNVKEQYKDLGQIEAMDTLTKDKPYLQQEAASIYSDIAKNPRDFFSGGSKFNEVQARLGKLQSLATESKQNALFDFAHRQYIAREPGLNNDENKAKLDAYLNQPLGQRQPYTLDLPGLYDPNLLAIELNKAVRTEAPFSRPTSDNQFIESGTAITYDLPKYLKMASTVYYQPDANGIPIKKTWEKRFNQFPANIQDYYKTVDPKDPAKAAYLDDLKNRILGNTIESYKTSSNPNYLKKEELKVKQANAGANQMRARAYSELTNKKIKDMDEVEKKNTSLWDTLVDNLKTGKVRTSSDENAALEPGRYIFAGDIPRGNRFISGIDGKGQPIELEPYRTPQGVEYYKTELKNKDGQPADETFLKQKYDESKNQNGFKGNYNDYIKQLVKNGAVDMYIKGKTREQFVDPTDKNKTVQKRLVETTANFESVMAAARALSNKINSDKEESIFQEDNQDNE